MPICTSFSKLETACSIFAFLFGTVALTSSNTHFDFQQLAGGDAPFAFYRLPHENNIHLVIQNGPDTELKQNIHWEANKGFLLAPFSKTSPTHFIRADYESDQPLVIDEALKVFQSFSLKAESDRIVVDKLTYLAQHQAMQAAFENKQADKAILSRIERIARPDKWQAGHAFKALTTAYPNAFVYLAYTPLTGCWMGASPEILLTLEKQKGQTVALAGTLPQRGEKASEVPWQKKEREEQAFVTQYIREALQGLNAQQIKENGPLSVGAGKVWHLKTTFEFELETPNNQGPELLNILHPTPAVCGTPQKEAQQLIEQVEPHQRRLYTGYLGPVGPEPQWHLFVNLRCMEVFQDALLLYLGGGLTKDSVAEKEWEETTFKAQTMLAIVQNI